MQHAGRRSWRSLFTARLLPNAPLSNFLQILAIFAIPAALTSMFGKMAGDRRQGGTLFGVMLALFLTGLATLWWAEVRTNPATNLPVAIEGKEVRFGNFGTAIFATATTDASCGAVNAMHDSFSPLGGLVRLVHMMLGEVIFGGVGAGLYGMLMFVILTVFLAGLMVGRTPEYLGLAASPRKKSRRRARALFRPTARPSPSSSSP